MSGFLIDTNVLSEYNRVGGPDPGVKHWLETTRREFQYVSVLTLAEIQKGIDLLAEGRRRSQLDRLFREELELWFAGRIIPIDRLVATHWAALVVTGIRTGRPGPTIDSLLAATALAHGLTIVTRNTRDFSNTGAPTLNPWSSEKSGQES